MGTVLRIVFQIAILYLFYFTGVWIQQQFNLLIPGSIIGMLLLFGLLMTKRFKAAWIEKGASFLLSHLSLLFVPVTVGIIDFFYLFKGRGFLSIVVVVLSSILVMVTSAFVSQWLAERKTSRQVDFVQMQTGKREEL